MFQTHMDFERVILLNMGTYPLLDYFMLNFFSILAMYVYFERPSNLPDLPIDLYPQYVDRFSYVFHGECSWIIIIFIDSIYDIILTNFINDKSFPLSN